MQRLTRARTVLALALVGALALAGCGGGNDNGAEQDLRDQLAMLQTDLDAANAAKMTAEAAQAAAAEAQADAEAAQATAETDRDAANTAKGAAEQAATNAMAAQAAAEGAQTDAEAAQATAEAAQIAAQTAQATAETDRDAAKAAQMSADAAQATAEAAQIAAVAAQATAETERDAAMAAEMAAEQAAADAMAAQMAADQAAAEAMAAQAAAEAARDTTDERLAEVEAERDAANDAAAEAKVAEATAKAAQMAAEGARDGAIADKMAAEEAAAAAKMAADEEVAMAEAKRDEYKMAAAAAAEAQAAAVKAQETAEMARDEAVKAQETAEMARGEAVKAQETAEMARDEAVKAQETAEMARDEAVKAQETAEMERDEAVKAQETAEMDKKAAEDELARVKGGADTDDMMAASVMAKALYGVLDDDQEVDATGSTDIMNILATSSDTTAHLMVDIENGMLTAKVAGYTKADADADMIEGWKGTIIENKAARRTVTVYSDVGTDGGLPLYDLYGSNRPMDGKPRSYDVDNSPSTTDIDWADVMRPDGKTTGGEEPGSAMFKGSVKGVPGTFTCPSVCTAPNRHSDGTVGTDNDAAGSWMFVPDNPNDMVEGADTMYLTFGWWLTKDTGGMPTGYGLVTADTGMGSDATTASTPGTLVGTATYEGAAAGKYALPSTEADTYEGGHFTAKATITADFDADASIDTASNDKAGISLSGKIDNFMTGDTSHDWTVKLMVDGNGMDDEAPTPLVMDPLSNLGSESGGALAPDGDAALTTEWSMGAGAVTVDGTWEPTFHHKPFPTGVTTGIPDTVTGTFNAMGDSGNLQGAFGANKVDE